MKMHLMAFDEARKTYNRKYSTKNDEYIFGIGRDAIPWGKNVEIDIETLDNSSNVPVYKLNGLFVPTCVFKTNDGGFNKDPFVNVVLRYGTTLIDDGPLEEMDAYVRIKIMSYKRTIYYIKMVNGEVVRVKKVGVVR